MCNEKFGMQSRNNQNLFLGHAFPTLTAADKLFTSFVHKIFPEIHCKGAGIGLGYK